MNSTQQSAQAVMVEQARLALEAFGVGDIARYDLHRLNARRIADSLGLSARREQREEVAAC